MFKIFVAFFGGPFPWFFKQISCSVHSEKSLRAQRIQKASSPSMKIPQRFGHSSQRPNDRPSSSPRNDNPGSPMIQMRDSRSYQWASAVWLVFGLPFGQTTYSGPQSMTFRCLSFACCQYEASKLKNPACHFTRIPGPPDQGCGSR